MSIFQITLYNAHKNILYLKVVASPYFLKNTHLRLHSFIVRLYGIIKRGPLSNILNTFFFLILSPPINNTYANIWFAYPGYKISKISQR